MPTSAGTWDVMNEDEEVVYSSCACTFCMRRACYMLLQMGVLLSSCGLSHTNKVVSPCLEFTIMKA